MNNVKVRIYELSKELNLDNRDMLAICDQLNISVTSLSSPITEVEAEQIRSAAERYIPSHFSGSNASVPTPSNSTAAQPQPRVENVKKKPQILEIRRPIIRPQPEAPPQSPQRSSQLPSQQQSQDSVPTQPSQQPKLPLRRTPRIGQGYIERRLDVGSAIPLHLVSIPGGTFNMGSPEDEPERQDDESPQHPVTVPPFFMSRYPITQDQWRIVAGLPPVEQALTPEPSHFKGKDNHPVERVSWHDAVEFCARLTTHTNRPYRLPTEAEWEYVCRAGTTTPFYFGNTLTHGIANYNASVAYANGPVGTGHNETTSVDSFGIANAFGLSDLHGNVWEWCQDHWHGNYEGAPTDGSAWLTDDKTASRLLRGGSWYLDPRNCRSASRNNYPVNRSNLIGFRVVCEVPRILQ